MLKWFITCLLLLSTAAVAEIDHARLNPPVEVRAIWLNADAIPKTDRGIRELVRSYHKANLNVLLPEVVARGYTAYPSKLLARDPRFAGAVDPLPPMIDEAHKLGMEIHPWVWVFRAGYTKDRGAILTAHPDWVEFSKWGEDLSANGGLWISPAIPAARDFLVNLFSELARNYDIDGVHLDYIRYEVESPTPYGYSEFSRSEFKRLYGIDPSEVERLSYSQLQWNRFRERQINSFVQRASLELRAIKPDLIISAAVGSDPITARTNLMQNWVNWAANKWVDYLTPMAYSSNDQTFIRLVTAQKAAVGNITLLAPGIGLHTQKSEPAQVARQVGIARKLLVSGHALFASSYYDEPRESALIAGPYAQPAAVPFRDPAAKSAIMANYAACAGQSVGAAAEMWYCDMAEHLAEYARYKQARMPYVPPTEPPLEIPETVVPLPSVEVPKAAGDITIDGSLDEQAWANAAKVELKFTNTGEPASVATTARLIYDNNNLYIAFESDEPQMDKLKATVEKRDGPTFYDDSVEIFVDPTAKRRDYYHLSTNTLGTRFDQKVFNVGWNGDWTSASKTGPSGWTTEIAIPFDAFKAPTPTPGTQWALNLTRNRATTGSIEYFTWAIPYGTFHSPDRFGIVRFGG